MKRYRCKMKEQDTPLKKITILCRDYDNRLENLLNKIKSTGNIGHSFDIVVDPDNEDHKETFGWDGDGSDYIEDIKIENEK